jgi:DNA repair protein RecO (recombination protein O)
MTTHYKTRAFIFKKNDMNESDRIFSVFTDDFGRLDIFAKAIRKSISKLRSGIDIFFMSEIEFIQGKRKKTLTDAATTEKFDNIYQDLDKFKIANRIGEVLDNFIKGEQKDKDLFNLLNEVFYKLNDQNLNNKKYALLYYYFLWNVLSLLGYCPEVQKCNICQSKLNPYGIYFSDRLGGIICKKCLGHDASAEKINSDIAKILRLIFKKEWHILSKLKIEPASQNLFQKISDNYYFYILSSHSFKNILRVGADVI